MEEYLKPRSDNKDPILKLVVNLRDLHNTLCPHNKPTLDLRQPPPQLLHLRLRLLRRQLPRRDLKHLQRRLDLARSRRWVFRPQRARAIV